MNELICGNSIEVLKTLDDECIDLIITSPPYNLGNSHHTRNNYHKQYDDDLPEADYQQQQIDILNECFRVLKSDGSMFYNHKNRIKKGIQTTPYEWLLKSKFIVKQEIVWINGSPNFDKIRFYPFTERVYWLAKDPKTKLQNNIGHTDVFDSKEWGAVGTKGVFKRAFPEKMVEDIISCFPDSKVILDPFVGSGTTCKVAKQMGRNYIGIYISQEHINVAKDRLEQSTTPDNDILEQENLDGYGQ